ncbi:DNA (cytosine-5)-methyltransferase, putative [Plasmodium relictum]|uniref:DNA (Cytosine-5)-methyltransferase, putative n=1 Tax=Plasmodium relictum TaxID=85471 RepID=A0A1J1HCK5_PLARL|nr:DNA (cytosine-5)-methyltransferase, putative [Plasmodium relictum]CRH03131.1 DNA (cytosine-5)-methyltransferase, putative [Plasmodium relictum]
MEKIKVLELFSGIGGFHYSLLQALINYINNWGNENIKEDLKNIFHFISLDLNHIANQTYYHNFQENSIYLTNKKDINKFIKKNFKNNESYERKTDSFNSKKQRANKNNVNHINDNEFNLDKNYIIQTDINNLTVQFFDFHQFDMLLISNPCQPYTRQNINFKEINLNEIILKNNYIKSQVPKPKEESNKNINAESYNHVYNKYSKNISRCIRYNRNAEDNLNILNANKNEKNHTYCDKDMNNYNNVNNCIVANKYNNMKNCNNVNYYNSVAEIYDKFNAENLDVDGIIVSLDTEKDERTNSFIHICNLLQNTKRENLPQYIFIENVKNFEVSSSFLYFINSIKKNYNFQTYLLSPLQFGIPNERLRFYCICKRKDNLNDTKKNITYEEKKGLLYSNSLIPQRYISFRTNEILKENEKITFYTPSIITYLDSNEIFSIYNKKFKNINIFNSNLNEHGIKKSFLQKKLACCFDILDINKKGNICCYDSNEYYVEKNKYINNLINSKMKNKKNSKIIHSMCFTSNYSRYINGSGSILYFSKHNNEEKNNNNRIVEKAYKDTLCEYKCEVRNEPEKEIVSSSTSEESNDLSYDYYSSEVSNICEYENKQMRKYEDKVRYFTPTEICRLMGFKMHTEKYNLKKVTKNTYGNIYWNIDHVNHKCAYTYNTHYCDINNINTCILNLKEYESNIKDLKKEKNEKKKCFCHEFTFPNFLTNRQKYKLIGNSVNTIVISLILQNHNIFEDFNIKNILH